MNSPLEPGDGHQTGNHASKLEAYDRWRADAEVRVALGHAAGGVTEKPLYFTHSHAAGEECRSGCVTQVIKPHAPELRAGATLSPMPADDGFRAERESTLLKVVRERLRQFYRTAASTLQPAHVQYDPAKIGRYEGMEFRWPSPGRKEEAQEEVPWTTTRPGALQEFADLVCAEIDRLASWPFHGTPLSEPMTPQSSLIPPADGHVHRVTEDGNFCVHGRCRDSCETLAHVSVDGAQCNVREPDVAKMLYEASRTFPSPRVGPRTYVLHPIEVDLQQLMQTPGARALNLKVFALC